MCLREQTAHFALDENVCLAGCCLEGCWVRFFGYQRPLVGFREVVRKVFAALSCGHQVFLRLLPFGDLCSSGDELFS